MVSVFGGMKLFFFNLSLTGDPACLSDELHPSAPYQTVCPTQMHYSQENKTTNGFTYSIEDESRRRHFRCSQRRIRAN